MPIRKRYGSWNLNDGAPADLDEQNVDLSRKQGGWGMVEDTNGYAYSYISQSPGQTASVSVAGDVSVTSYYDSNYSYRRRKTSPRGNMGTIG